MIGLVKSVAREFYDLVIDMHVQDYNEMSDKELCHHYVLAIDVVVKDDNYLERECNSRIIDMQYWDVMIILCEYLLGKMKPLVLLVLWSDYDYINIEYW